MNERTKALGFWAAFAVGGGVLVSVLTPLPFWAGALLGIFGLAVNGWVANRVDNW